MIETFQIFLQLFALLIFFLFPITFSCAQKFINDKINIYENISINIIINSFLLLIISFFNINLIYIFWTVIFFVLIQNYKFFYTILNITNDEKKIFIFFITCFFSTGFSIAASATLEWDALAHWFYKVLNFNQGFGLENFDNLPWGFYPHLGTYIWNFFCLFIKAIKFLNSFF